MMMRAALSIAVVIASAQGLAQTPAVSEAQDFVQALQLEYPFLVPEVERVRLDELNRTLRAAENTLRRSESEQEKAEAAANAQVAMDELLAMLESRPRITATDASTPESWQAAHTEPLSSPGDQWPALEIGLGSAPTRSRLLSPISLPGDTGALFLRVAGEGEGVRFLAQDFEFASPMVSMNVVPPHTGVTWVLAGLRNMPQGKTTSAFQVQPADGAQAHVNVTFQTPAWGYLSASVLSADTGEVVPAMVQLVWDATGKARAPLNAVDLSPHFEGQGTSAVQRNFGSPGPLSGTPFWCVNGKVNMALPPGEWRMSVRRGIEHRPAIETFTVASGERVEKTVQPERWIDMRQHGWYSGDDHVHSRIMSDDDAARVMAWIQAEDIHLANIVKMGDIHRTYFEQRGFGEAFRVVKGDYILSPGQECPRTHGELGHTLSMNIKSMVRDTEQYYLYDWVFDSVQAQGGLSGYAHVNADLFFVHRDMSLNIPKGKVDFAELLQFSNLGTDLYYAFLNLGFPLTASAGSDVPWGGTVGEVRVYAYTGDQPFTADAWFDAVDQGHTFVTNGPMIDMRVNDTYLPGDELEATSGEPLHVHASVWGMTGQVAPITVEVLRFDEVVHSVETSGPDAGEATIDVDVDPGFGCWIAIRARGADGSSAHTTPVYVTREGFRWWKYEAVEDLIVQRLASLDEIRKLVNEAVEKFENGSIDYGRRDHVQLALQGPALLERVTAAEQIYEDLRKVHASEAASRTK